MSIEALVLNVRHRFAEHDGAALGAFFRPLDTVHIASLQAVVQTRTPDALRDLVTRRFGDELARQGALVLAFFDYARIAAPSATDAASRELDFDALSTTYSAVNAILRDAFYFAPALRNLSRALAKLAIEVARSHGTTKHPKTEAAVRLLMTALSYALVKMAPGQASAGPSQGDAALTLANELFRIYFFMNNLKLCDTVLSKIGSVEGQLDVRYPRSETVLYRYFRGRIFLYQRNLLQAQLYLAKAFEMCTSASPHNRRAILIYLVGVCLPVGRMPPRPLLGAYDLLPQYGPLSEAVKIGDWLEVTRCLDEWKDWHRRHGTYILLREKLEVLCWRNLFRNLAGLKPPVEGVEEPRRAPLSLISVVEPARKVFEDETIDEDDVECMAYSLIEQNLIRGYVKTGTAVVFSRQNALPSVQEGLAVRRAERERGD